MRLPLACTWIFVAVACVNQAKDGDAPSEDDDVAADTAAPRDPDPSETDQTETDVAETDPPGDSDGAPETDVADTDAADTAVADTSLTGDGDGVPDRLDRCPGLDDRVDLDADLVPDCTQTVLTNAQFSADITGWIEETEGGRVVDAAWSADDASGWRRSGSLEVVNRTPSASEVDSGVLTVCVPLNGATVLDVAYQYMIPTGQGVDLRLTTRLIAFADDACTDVISSLGLAAPAPATRVDGAWHTMTPGGSFLFTNRGDRAVQVRIALRKPENAGPKRFQIDDVLVRLR